MHQISYQQIQTLGDIYTETAHYTHMHDPAMPDRYDSNYLAFKQIPTLSAFKEAEAYLRAFHLQRGQQHVKFLFPENKKPSNDVLALLEENGYATGYTELYKVEPKQFNAGKQKEGIEIVPVTSDTLAMFLKLQFDHDMQYGTAFAEQKQTLLRQQTESIKQVQLLALYENTPAGSMEVILEKETAEIDNLFVKATYRKKGIGTALQQYIMDHYPYKTVILIADGEDTPRNMYQKQGYQYQGYRYETQKLYQV